MEADRRSPVFAEGRVDVAADIETVWGVVSSIERYAEWNPDVKEVSMEGPLREGTTFRWKSGPGTITSTIQQVDAPRKLVWTGKTFSVKAVHVWRLEPGKDERTSLRLEESWHGLLASVLRGSLRKTLREAVDSGLRYLKTEAERRAGRETSPPG